MPERPVRVGLVGLGTIGTGVVRIFQEHASEINRRLGFPLELAHIADIDLESDRGVELDAYQLSTDFKKLVHSPEIDLVVELIGGTRIAADVVSAALQSGKGVVTANKALLAHRGQELYALAQENVSEIAFEASVGGTIPVLRALREGLAADRIESIRGILNGTCNYVLTEMEERGEPYEACLKRAQDLGYAEADPTFDIDGTDSAHKLAILLGLGFGLRAGPDAFARQGIDAVTSTDIEVARRLGYRIKLLASARRTPAGVEARVEPTMIDLGSILASVSGSMNAIEVRGAMSGPTLYYGAGAGSLPTASAVVADLMELARARRLGAIGRVPPLGSAELDEGGLCPAGHEQGEYCLRMSTRDQDVAAPLTAALSARGIGLAALLQDVSEGDAVAITRRCSRSELDAGLTGLPGPIHVIRIEAEVRE